MSTATTPDLRRVSGLLKQAGDPTRLQILLVLKDGERNVGELVREVEHQSQPALSHHLSLCRFGGLVEFHRSGKNNVYSLTDRGRSLVALVETLDLGRS